MAEVPCSVRVCVFCTCKCVCASSVWPSVGLPLKHPPCEYVWDMRSPPPCLHEQWAGQGSRGASPGEGQSGGSAALSCSQHGVLGVHGGKSWLTSVVLSCRFSGVRTDEALACFYSLCFSLSFFIPSSSSSHSAIKQNKLSSLRSARRLVLFTSYPSTVRHVRWDFSSR